MNSSRIDVIIPAYNEEKSIGKVLEGIPHWLVRNIIVCNNNSSDRTGDIAGEMGAVVIDSTEKGYGNACLSGMEYIKGLEQSPDIIVFLDGDYSDYPDQMERVVDPIIKEGFQLVIGSRALGSREKKSMQPHQVFGNWLATRMIKLFYGYNFTDLGPFRAITWDALKKIKMVDKNYGWTVEMQVKAAKYKLKSTEVPVDYRERIGVSKVSGTVKGSVLAGLKIITTIFKHL